MPADAVCCERRAEQSVMQQRGDVEPDPGAMSSTEPRSKRVERQQAVEAKIARAACDLALERLQPRFAVAVANAVLRDQLDRLSDEQARARTMKRLLDGFG
jgi:hypothetical protein